MDLSGIADAFATAGVPGVLLLFLFLQTWLGHQERKASQDALNNRDALITDMVDKLAETSRAQSESNLAQTVALSRIESRLGLPGPTQ